MEKGGGSRLMQMQRTRESSRQPRPIPPLDQVDVKNKNTFVREARFQQKQMQEREMKIASLYEAQQARALDRVRHSPSNGHSNGSSISSPPQAVAHQPGKVRQMFEERRTKAGIDKSYPLQPIHNTERARKALPNGYTKVTASSVTNTRVEQKRTNKMHSTSQTTIKKVQQKTDNIVNGSGDLNHNHEPDLNSLKNALPQNKGEPLDEVDTADNNYLLENETFPEALAPAPTPRSPEPKAPPRRSPATRNSPPKTKPITTTPPKRVNNENSVSDVSKSRGTMQKQANSVPTVTRKQPAVSSPVTSSPRKARGSPSGASAGPGSHAGPASAAADTRACTVCGRHFAPDRLAKHEEICKKAHSKKRKPFDALKHRLAGTEAEPFINKLRKTNTNPSSTKTNKPLNNTWRQKHQEFIQAIRAAKQVQAHIAAGGKLSDLPPPPPSENPDYVSCPHCGRRFNQAAAERHIPKCKDYQFNKPKPGGKKR